MFLYDFCLKGPAHPCGGPENYNSLNSYIIMFTAAKVYANIAKIRQFCKNAAFLMLVIILEAFLQ